MPHGQASSRTMDVSDRMLTEIKDPAPDALDAWLAENRLAHRKAELRAFLGTETIDDLDDVLVRDLKTLRSTAWAESTLTIAEANRLRRAVQTYHAKKHPPSNDKRFHAERAAPTI